MTSPHEFSADDVMAFFDGELPEPRAAAVKAHVARCARCQAIGRDAAEVSGALAAWRVEPPTASLAAPAVPQVRPRWISSPVAKVALATAASAVLILGGRSLRCEVTACGRDFAPPPSAPPTAAAPPAQNVTLAENWFKQPRVALKVDGPDARVIIVAFMDWLCAACHGWETAYRPVLARYEDTQPDAVRFVLKDWPWEKDCNPHIPYGMGMHAGSCTAALAVRLARDRGKAEAMIAWLRDHLDALAAMSPEEARDAIKAEVRRLLAIEDFDGAAAHAIAARQADIEEGSALKIVGTPTYFINGVRIGDARQTQQLPPSTFDAVIALEIQKSMK